MKLKTTKSLIALSVCFVLFSCNEDIFDIMETDNSDVFSTDTRVGGYEYLYTYEFTSESELYEITVGEIDHCPYVEEEESYQIISDGVSVIPAANNFVLKVGKEKGTQATRLYAVNSEGFNDNKYITWYDGTIQTGEHRWNVVQNCWLTSTYNPWTWVHFNKPGFAEFNADIKGDKKLPWVRLGSSGKLKIYPYPKVSVPGGFNPRHEKELGCKAEVYLSFDDNSMVQNIRWSGVANDVQVAKGQGTYIPEFFFPTPGKKSIRLDYNINWPDGTLESMWLTFDLFILPKKVNFTIESTADLNNFPPNEEHTLRLTPESYYAPYMNGGKFILLNSDAYTLTKISPYETKIMTYKPQSATLVFDCAYKDVPLLVSKVTMDITPMNKPFIWSSPVSDLNILNIIHNGFVFPFDDTHLISVWKPMTTGTAYDLHNIKIIDLSTGKDIGPITFFFYMYWVKFPSKGNYRIEVSGNYTSLINKVDVVVK